MTHGETRQLGAAGVGVLSFHCSNDNPHKPRPAISQAAIPSAAARRTRLQYLARRLHALGERPLFHFLAELERGEPLRPHLERYAALPVDFIKANGGSKFEPPFLRLVDGGRSKKAPSP